MKGWLKIIDTVGSWLIGVVFFVLFAWHGWSELYRWSMSGELLAHYGSRSSSRWELITYESDPSKFVESFIIEVMMTLVGSALCFTVFWDIRKWWINKPKPTVE